MGNLEIFLNELFKGIMLGCFFLFIGLIVFSQRDSNERSPEESYEDRESLKSETEEDT